MKQDHGKPMKGIGKSTPLFAIVAGGVFLLAAIGIADIPNVLPLKGIAVLLLEVILLYLSYTNFRDFIWKEKRFLLGGFILLSLAAQLFLTWKFSFDFFSRRSYMFLMILIAAQIPLYLLMSLYAASYSYRIPLKSFHMENTKNIDLSVLLSLILLIGMVFLYSPMTLHVSDVEVMPFPVGELFLWHLILSLAAFSFTYLFYRLSAERLRPILSIIIIVITIAAWIYTYLLPGNYGVLDVVILTNPGRLAGFRDAFTPGEIGFIILEISALTIFATALIIVWKKAIKRIIPVLIILNLMTLGQSIFNILITDNLWESKASSAENAAFLPDDSERTFRFSTNGNIVIFMLDMFGADLVPDILEEYPDIKDSLDGFVWYPSTIPTGTATYPGLPAILAGYDFTPPNVNRRDDRLMTDMFQEAYAYYPEISRNRGYDMTFINPVYFSLEDKAEDWGISVVEPDNYMEYWLNSSREASELSLNMTAYEYTRMFSVIGLFKASPFFIRPVNPEIPDE